MVTRAGSSTRFATGSACLSLWAVSQRLLKSDECHLDLVNPRRIDRRLVIFWRMLLPGFGHGRWYRENGEPRNIDASAVLPLCLLRSKRYSSWRSRLMINGMVAKFRR